MDLLDSKLNQEEIDNLNRSITSSEIESVTKKKKKKKKKKILQTKGQDQMSSQVNSTEHTNIQIIYQFYQTYRIYYNPSQTPPKD